MQVDFHSDAGFWKKTRVRDNSRIGFHGYVGSKANDLLFLNAQIGFLNHINCYTNIEGEEDKEEEDKENKEEEEEKKKMKRRYLQFIE